MFRIYCFWLILFLSDALPAQSSSDSIHYIPEVFVDAHRAQEVILPEKLSGKVLQGLSAHSVADAMRYFSGVQIKDYGGVGGVRTVDIRSMGSHHVGIYYDGFQLGNAQNGQVDLGKYSLDNVEQISIYSGQKSNIFQPARHFSSSSSVYLQTRKPSFDTNQHYNLTSTLRTGSFGLINGALLWEQQIIPSLRLSLNTEYTLANGKYKFRMKKVQDTGETAYDTTATRENGDIQSFRAEAALFGDLSRGNWNVKGYYYNSERGIPGAVVNNVLKRSERQWDNNSFVQAFFEQRINSRYRFKVQAKYAYDYTHFLRNDPKELPIDNHYHLYEGYLSSVHCFTILPDWDFSFAVDMQWNKLNANLVDFAYPTRFTEMFSFATQYHIGPIHMQASLLNTLVQESVASKKLSAASPNRSIWSPAFFFSYKPFAQVNWKVSAFAKHCFRMPTFNDLYYTEIGTSYLKPETTNQINIGTTYSRSFHSGWLKELRITADTYYNQVDNKIIAYPTGGLFRWTMINLGSVHIHGIELKPQLDFSLKDIRSTLLLTYAWKSARNFTDPTEEYYQHQIPYNPQHSGSAIAAFYWRQWQLNTSFIYVGERYTRSANLPEYYLQPWYTTDISISKEIPIRSVVCRITGEVTNLFDQAYEVVEGYPMPGINFRLIFRVMI